jgi:hypothetical protein
MPFPFLFPFQMMINCVSTNSTGRQYGNILYMVRGIQTQDFLNILNKNNAKIAISQTGETNGNVGKVLTLGTLSTEISNEQQQQQQHEGVIRLENSERLFKNGQLIIKSIDKAHPVLVIRNTNNDSSTPQLETEMSIETLETMEASSKEDNESVVTISTQKIAPLVGSGK